MKKKHETITSITTLSADSPVPIHSAANGFVRRASDPLDGFAYTVAISLADGECVVGTLVGRGPDRELFDETGEVRVIATWRLRPPGRDDIILELGGSASLDRQLAAIAPGSEVAIHRYGQERTRRGRVVTRYAVGVRSRS